MQRTLFFGGTTYLGYQLAKRLKETERTYLHIVDDSRNKNRFDFNYTTFEEFLSIDGIQYTYSRIIINFYEILKFSFFSLRKRDLVLRIINHILELVTKNPKTQKPK